MFLPIRPRNTAQTFPQAPKDPILQSYTPILTIIKYPKHHYHQLRLFSGQEQEIIVSQLFSHQGLASQFAATCSWRKLRESVKNMRNSTNIENIQYISILARCSLPPPPPMDWSQKPMKTWYLQCFLHGGWLARCANLQIPRISCNQPSENVLFAMFRLRHRGVVPMHPLLCQIIISYNSKSSN